jgi:hypothetical protein
MSSPARTAADTPAPAPSFETSLARARALARVMDDAVRVPGTRIGFGLDALIGLVPGIGDMVGAAMSGYIIFIAARGGVPASVLLRMLANIATDSIVGAVPLLGDLFDIGFKANRRNMDLLDRFVAEPGPTRRASRGVVGVIFLGVALLIGASLALAALLINGLLALFN